jgi:hypothetical protein
MALLRIGILGWLALVLVSCGSGPKGISGDWYADLVSPQTSPAPAFYFSANLTPQTGSNIAVSNFLLNPQSACFSGGTGQVASFSVTGSSNGVQIGKFAMTVSTHFPGVGVNSILVLQGTRNNDGTITGNWTLTGTTGCTGRGSFNMTSGGVHIAG